MGRNSNNTVVKNVANCLVHAPDLVQHGSKPRREIGKDIKEKENIKKYLRQYSASVMYQPNQAFIGNITPQELADIERPWYKTKGSEKQVKKMLIGKFGEIMDQLSFYMLLKFADVLEPPLFEIKVSMTKYLLQEWKNITSNFVVNGFDLDRLQTTPDEIIEGKIRDGSALAIVNGDKVIGCFNRDNRAEGRDDENLMAHHLLENLCNKASGALAMKWLFHREGMTPDKVDFIISCGEEACGDRYQRSGGGMAKAIGEMCGCVNASGIDIKNFCAAPSSAIITAASMVKAGLYENIVVVGGGSLAKLGMKYKAFVGNDMPILDDCLSSMAILISKDDGKSPVIQMESGTVGKASIGSSKSDEKVYKDIILKPLKALGLKMTDIDRYAPELQNPEIMEFAGSGDVAKKNYRKIAAMAVISKQLEKKEMNSFIEKIGMPGFAPTQGHIPSAVPYLAHALEEMKAGKITRAMFVGKASLFLGRHTSIYDGVSFILKRNLNAK